MLCTEINDVRSGFLAAYWRFSFYARD